MTDPKPTAAEVEQKANLTGVGDCLQAWSEVEHSLTTLFAVLMETDQYAKVVAAHSAVANFRARILMIDRIVEGFEGPEFNASWASLSNSLLKLNDKRNEIAHFSIVHTVERPIPYLRPYYTVAHAPPTKLSSADLKVRANVFLRAQSRVVNHKDWLLYRRGQLSADALQGRDPDRLICAPDAQTPAKT